MPPLKSETFSCFFLLNMDKELLTADYPIIPVHRKKSGPLFTVTDSCIRLGIDTVAI
jgi:hypothetical protein